MTDYYIDPSQISNGVGTKADPFNTLTELDALVGDQLNDVWHIRRGTKTRSTITYPDTALTINLTISAYGAVNVYADPTGRGTEPEINGADIIAAWTDEGADQWSISESKIRGVFIDDVEMLSVATQAEMINNTLWWDSTNSRLYIQTVKNPNVAITEVTARRTIDINSTGVTGSVNITLLGLHTTKSDSSGCKFFGGVQDCKILGCVSSKNGSWDGSSCTGFSLLGTSNTVLDTGLVMRDCLMEWNQNNMVETQFITGALIEDIEGHNNGMGLEIWGYTQNSTFRRFKMTNNKARGTFAAHGNAIWLTNIAQGVDTGYNSSNTFSYIEGIGCSAVGLSIDAGSNNLFYNCTIAVDNVLFNALRVKQPGAETDANKFVNCILVITNSASALTVANFDPLTATVVLKNYYHTAASITARVKWEDGVVYSTFTEADYKLASLETGAFADPLLMSDIDATLQDASSCIGAGDALGLVKDVNKYALTPVPDIGANQWHVPIYKSSMSAYV